jgi:ribosome-binding protein aMBF1 (putative translation factor)
METKTERTRKEVANHVGTIVKTLREQKGFTRYKLAKLIYGKGKEQIRVQRIEDGIIVPDIHTLEKILLHLEVDFKQILNTILKQ